MTLHEALRTLPPETVLQSHLDNRLYTIAELLDAQKDESGYEVKNLKRNYGDSYYVVVAVGYGVIYSEAQS